MILIAYSTISYGSSGESVKKLQQTLNEKGYSLTVDGVFGTKTQSAVKDYQKKNGLTVDGIVGAKTWGSFESTKKDDSVKSSVDTASTKADVVSERPEYQKSDTVVSAENKLSQWENNKPDDYVSKYSEKIDELLEKALNRDAFSYKLSDDPIYAQYRDIYTKNGKKAMQDAIGEAVALTGGYANSYAESVGYEAYDEYLGQLNQIALDLRDRAYDEYSNEGNKIIDDISLLRSLDGDDYEKYISVLEQYYDDGDYLLEKLSMMSDDDFNAFLAKVEAWENDREYQFEKYQDELDRAEFEEEMAFKKAEAEREQANEDRDYLLAVQKAASSSGADEKEEGSESVGSYPTSYTEFVSRTGYGGIMTENLFNQSEKMKKTYGDYKGYLEEMYKKYS